MDQIVSKVEKQEIEIDYIKRSLDELVEQNKNQSKQLDKISESIKNQELILEKISNLDDKYEESIKRCHNRIDEEIERCKDINGRMDKELDRLKEDVLSRPCRSHDVFVKELEYIKKELNKYAKIVWWGGTLIIGVVIVSILKTHLH